MLIGKPLFPGSSTIDQIEKIFSRLEQGSFKKFKKVCTDYVVSLVEKAATKEKKETIRDKRFPKPAHSKKTVWKES